MSKQWFEEAIQPRTKQESVKNAIPKYVREHDLRPGDQLPSERELAALTGFNRLTIRKAVKELCAEGVLEQVPKRGTFLRQVEQRHEEDGVDAIFAPMGSFFIRPQMRMVRFALDDVMPEQQAAWHRIVEGFQETHEGIAVKLDFRDGAQLRAPQAAATYDVVLGTLRLLALRSAEDDLPSPGFGPDWFERHPWLDAYPKALRARLEGALRHGDGYLGVPIYAAVPLHVYRRDRLEELGLKEPPHQPSLEELADWLTSVRAMGRAVSAYPFVQSLLNHLLRQDRELINGDPLSGLNLDRPSCRRVLPLLRAFDSRQSGQPSVWQVLRSLGKGEAVSLELFSNAFIWLPGLIGRQLDTLSAVGSSLSGSGQSQVMFTVAMLGRDLSRHAEAVAFCHYLASPGAQHLIAEQLTGLPVSGEPEGLTSFCKRSPLADVVLRDELGRAESCFEHPCFTSEYQQQILGPALQLYRQEAIQLDDVIRQAENGSREWVGMRTQLPCFNALTGGKS